MIGVLKSSDNILIVDDIADSGQSLQEAIKQIKKIDPDAKNVDIATIHYKPKSIIKPTYYADKVSNDTWVAYPWEKETEK